MNNKKYFMMLIALMGISHSVHAMHSPDFKAYAKKGAKKGAQAAIAKAKPVVSKYVEGKGGEDTLQRMMEQDSVQKYFCIVNKKQRDPNVSAN